VSSSEKQNINNNGKEDRAPGLAHRSGRQRPRGHAVRSAPEADCGLQAPTTRALPTGPRPSMAPPAPASLSHSLLHLLLSLILSCTNREGITHWRCIASFIFSCTNTCIIHSQHGARCLFNPSRTWSIRCSALLKELECFRISRTC
jgi:hypothetical protein